jgi:hypothetical protein
MNDASRVMFVSRLENMQKNGDAWLTITAVLALLNDCDMLAAREATAPPPPLTAESLKRNGRYNWKGQPDRLIYLRKFDGWHQFKKIGDPREVWCEVRAEDLHMLEETA